MLSTLLAQYGHWLLLIGALFFGLAVFKAVRAGIQSRNAAYYALRGEAIGRLRRWALLAVLVLIATVVLVILINNPPLPQAIAARTPTSTPIVITATHPASPSPSPTATSTPPPSPTPSLTPTNTPTPTATARPGSVPNLLLTPIPSAVPPAPNAKLTFTTLASVLDNNGNPVDAGAVFPSGTQSVKVFFRASNVNNGAVWSVFCYKGNKLVDNYVGLWKWGTRSQGGRAFCAIDGSTGAYKAVGYLGTTQQFEVSFTLIVPPTAAPTVGPTLTAQP